MVRSTETTYFVKSSQALAEGLFFARYIKVTCGRWTALGHQPPYLPQYFIGETRNEKREREKKREREEHISIFERQYALRLLSVVWIFYVTDFSEIFFLFLPLPWGWCRRRVRCDETRSGRKRWVVVQDWAPAVVTLRENGIQYLLHWMILKFRTRAVDTQNAPYYGERHEQFVLEKLGHVFNWCGKKKASYSGATNNYFVNEFKKRKTWGDLCQNLVCFGCGME